MKRKRAFIATLSLAMVTTAMIAFASTSTTQEKGTPESSEIESAVTHPPIEDHLESTTSDDKPNSIGDTAKGGAVVPKYFTVNAGYGHLRLLIKNNSRHPVRVNLIHRSTDKLYFSREIDGNKSITWENYDNGYEQGTRGGEYVLQWSGAGYKVNGEFTGKMGSSVSDVIK